MGTQYVCPRCGNRTFEKIGYLNHVPYCRACIIFSGADAVVDTIDDNIDPTLELTYHLSEEQQRLGQALIEAYEQKQNVLIHAVTGAGKTEIVFPLIQHALMKKAQIGFAIPRRDVVIELTKRFEQAFPHINVIAVYGGHHDKLAGDLIILTTHQIYRYEQTFDLLIIDEFDAFPFKDNEVLMALATRSRRGPLVALTATPTSTMMRRFQTTGHKILHLWTRYHRHPLPIPRIVKRHFMFKIDYTLDFIKLHIKKERPIIVFVPTIQSGESLFRWLKCFCNGGALVHSKCKDRETIINDFRKRKYRYLVSTSVLERGITLTNLQVLIYDAHHSLFDRGTLLQMAGRVGRKSEAPTGDVVFLAIRSTNEMKEAIREISYANQHL